MLPFGAKTFPGLSFTWNLEPYIHNCMSITEACDRAEFAQMDIKEESSEQREVRGNQAIKGVTDELVGRSRVSESW